MRQKLIKAPSNQRFRVSLTMCGREVLAGLYLSECCLAMSFFNQDVTYLRRSNLPCTLLPLFCWGVQMKRGCLCKPRTLILQAHRLAESGRTWLMTSNPAPRPGCLRGVFPDLSREVCPGSLRYP